MNYLSYSMLKLHPRMAIAFSAALALTATVEARQLSVDEALGNLPHEIALPLLTRSNPEPVYTQSVDGLNVAYILSAGNKGYAVLAADDILPPLLGYSDEATLDSSAIPPAMMYWLEEYGRQLSYALANSIDKVDISESRAARQPIAPLCSAKWNQSQPFNNLTPDINGKHTPTGCTATAMAQLAYAHKWPVKGSGENSYISGDLRQRLTFDFGSTTFDWVNMKDSYAGAYTEAEASAVATLMLACGNAALMSYNASASGAYPYDAVYGMVKFMGYDKAAMNLSRDFYSSPVWDELIYTELAKGNPVMYGGYDSSYQNGHTFIVDGYSENGFYHLNWGWGGMSNGYFLLTGLDPKEQGIGGSGSGYNFRQNAVVNLMPAQDDSDYGLEVMWDGAFTTGKKSYSAGAEVDFTVSGDGEYSSFNLVDMKAEMGVKLIPVDGGEPTFYAGTEVDFPSFYGSSNGSSYKEFTVPVSSLPASGKYIATPAFRYNGKVSDVVVKVGAVRSLVITCSRMGVKFEDVAVERTLTATDVTVQNTLYSGRRCTVTAVIHNSGEEYLGLVKAGLANSDGEVLCWLSDVPVNIEDGGSMNVTFTGDLETLSSALPAGEYVINIYNEAEQIISKIPRYVTVLEAPTGAPIYNVTFNMAGNNSGDGTAMNPYLIGDEISLEMTVAVSSGLFDDIVALYPYYEGTDAETDFSGSGSAYKTFFVAPGESQTITYTLGTSDFEMDKLVYVVAYGWKSDKKTPSLGYIGRKIYLKRVTNGIHETLSDKTGLTPNPAVSSTTVTAGGNIVSIRLHSLSGSVVATSAYDGSSCREELNVASLAPGHYVVVVTTTAGVESHQLIKR